MPKVLTLRIWTGPGTRISEHTLLCAHGAPMGSTEANICPAGHFLTGNRSAHSAIILSILLPPTYCNLQVCVLTRAISEKGTTWTVISSRTKSTWDNQKQINEYDRWIGKMILVWCFRSSIHPMLGINITANLERMKKLSLINNLSCVKSKHMYPPLLLVHSQVWTSTKGQSKSKQGKEIWPGWRGCELGVFCKPKGCQGSISSQGMSLGDGPGPWFGTCDRQPINVSLFLPPFLL